MKVAVMHGKRDVRIEDRPMPIPGDNQLVVKIDYCGICGSDVDTFHHGWSHGNTHPMVLGHEKVGTVYSVGKNVTEYKVGDKLLCGPPSYCEDGCPSCKCGRPNICLTSWPRTAGLGGPDGGYAEYMLVEDPKHTLLVKIPEGTDLKDAVLFDIFGVSFHGVRISNFRIGDNVVVSGAGPIGLAAISILKAAGANKIIALNTTTSKFPLIRQYGADYCINVRETKDLAAEIKAICGNDVGADVTYECAGTNESLENCVYHCTKPGGQVMLIGGIKDPMTLVIENFIIHEVDLKTSFVYTPEEIKMYLDMVNSGKLYLGPMVTKIVSIDDCVKEGLDLKDRTGQIKILIDPSL